MKFQCSSCGLRMASLHFKQAGLMNPKLTSICDICIQRGLDPEEYANDTVATFAKALLYAFIGKDGEQEVEWLVKTRQLQKRYEGFIQDYDNNAVALQQVDRAEFNRAIIASQDGLRPAPDSGREFSYNLEQLGLQVDFQLNEVDYIDRERIRAKYRYRCQYCGRKGHSVDHKDPVSLSHNNDFSNLILACSECNRIKSDMPYDLFVSLNEQLKPINRKLVKYENSLGTLKEEFQHRRSYLAAQVHLKGVVADPELNAIRKENKKLQDAIDTLQSDYDELRHVREEYFATHWRLSELEENSDIV
ncbi:HNH endonuclease [Lactobacillus pasteurii]|nr:HNH endonuclease signature motif containing protein [Lactobacillus pasteurii]